MHTKTIQANRTENCNHAIAVCLCCESLDKVNLAFHAGHIQMYVQVPFSSLATNMFVTQYELLLNLNDKRLFGLAKFF